MTDYTEDYLLDKQIKIFQPRDGYRASTDAVILSAMVDRVKKGDEILDVGSGTGAISLCLAHRFQDKDVQIVGLELQERLAELSNMSAEANGFEGLEYVNCDIRNVNLMTPPDLPLKGEEIGRGGKFGHVVTNPPYSEVDMPSPNESKSLAHNHQGFSLKEWIGFCIKMMKPKGFFYMINRAEAVDEILHNIYGKLGNIRIVPIYSKIGQDAKRVVIIGQKGTKSVTKIDKGLVVHKENGEYSEKANMILRQGMGYF